ncbi:unnamed protein product [Blepharisma stoltei]|uniref:Uncharacterized protein n=1 Tax=Blepharisma stoltei TaxID=1481888 RepID=A0AAU9JIM6_9CILI|nr:unnamed protein product [Blepharisma stoltei]
MNLLENKNIPLSYIAETISSDRDEGNAIDKEADLQSQGEEKPKFFNDLMDLKKNLNFNPIPTIETEETQEAKWLVKRNQTKARGELTVLMRETQNRKHSVNFTIEESNME